MENIYEIHKLLDAKNILLAYEGEFSQEVTRTFLSMTEKNLETRGEENPIKRKVFNVMMECLQNIVKHSDRQEEKEAIFMIGKEEESYVIYSGNYIPKSDIAYLEEKLNYINSLSREEIKEYYKSLIKETKISDKGGAGLGFVDIAKKTGQPLEYEFHEVNEKTSFFTFKSRIAKQ